MKDAINGRFLIRRVPALLFALVVGAAPWLAAAPAAVAQTTIELLVNDQPITSYDIQQRTRFLTATRQPNAGRQAAVEELIDEILKLQESRRLGVSIGDAEVDERFGLIAGNMRMNAAQLTTALRGIGVNAETIKRRIRADLAWQRVIQQRFRQDSGIREQDIQLALAERGDAAKQVSIEYTLQQIVLLTTGGRSAASRKGDAETIRARFAGCASTNAAIAGIADTAWKNIGRRAEGDLPPAMRETLAGLEAGQISAAYESNNGLEMLAVCDRREIEQDTVARREVETELMTERGGALARRLIMDLRQSAVIEYR